jgi:hypothetical protein
VFAQLRGIKRTDAEQTNRSATYAKALQLPVIKLHQSILLWRTQVGIHLLILFCLCWGFWPSVSGFWQSAGVLIAICLALVVHLYYLWCLHRQANGRLWVSGNHWHWQDENGHRELVLAGSITVWPKLIILPFKEPGHGQRKTLILLPDSASADDLRCLRSWLRTSLNQ